MDNLWIIYAIELDTEMKSCDVPSEELPGGSVDSQAQFQANCTNCHSNRRMQTTSCTPMHAKTRMPSPSDVILSIYLSIYRSIYRSIYLTIYLSSYLSIYLTIYTILYIYRSLCLELELGT